MTNHLKNIIFLIHILFSHKNKDFIIRSFYSKVYFLLNKNVYYQFLHDKIKILKMKLCLNLFLGSIFNQNLFLINLYGNLIYFKIKSFILGYFKK